ncbi:MAG: NDP-sugar synthase [Promethearchaeota archaeon]|nr:MAG: NDP-sugar synthase [Candidatus Lokiarchaeota archaeon]
MNLNEIEELLNNKDKINKEEFRTTLKTFLNKNVIKNKIDEYIGDFPSIIEPVVLGKNVKIGDDVLLGPNVLIGDNVEIGDYDEISNTIILDNSKLGEIFKLDYCIIEKDTKCNFNNLNIRNCILGGGEVKSVKKINKKCF